MGLLWTAITDPNPCVFIDHVRLFAVSGPVPAAATPVPFGQARVARRGRDVTVVATSHMVVVALQAADRPHGEGIEVEVIDPRTLVPFDDAAVMDSVRRTGRLVVVDETHLTAGVGSEIAVPLGEQAFADLRAPVLRVGTADVPMPFSPPLEAAAGRKAMAYR